MLSLRTGRLPKFADWAEARITDASLLTEWQVYRMFEARRGAWSTFQFLVREALASRASRSRPTARSRPSSSQAASWARSAQSGQASLCWEQRQTAELGRERAER